VIGLPMTTTPFNETNPFAMKFVGPKKTASSFSDTSQSRSIGGLEKRSRTLGSKFRNQQPWNIDAAILLDKVYQITGAWSEYVHRLLSDEQTEISIAPKLAGSASIFLENTRRMRTRDVQVVVAGALMTTGLSILADFSIEIVALLAHGKSRTRRRGPCSVGGADS
jgi:hypothetical protein